jgi:hypothetical protein
MPSTFSSIGNSSRQHARKDRPVSAGLRLSTIARTRAISIKFSTKDCQVCPSRSLCTQSSRHTRRTVTIRPHQQYLALMHRREQEQTKEFTQTYAKRAGIEGTISKASSDDGHAPFSLHWAGEDAPTTSGYCRCSQSGSQHRMVQWAVVAQISRIR